MLLKWSSLEWMSAKLLILERGDTGQGFAFEHFEACAATRRNVGDLVGKSSLFHRRYRVAAADDGGRALLGQVGKLLRHRSRSRRELVLLEHSHRTIPDDGFRA